MRVNGRALLKVKYIIQVNSADNVALKMIKIDFFIPCVHLYQNLEPTLPTMQPSKLQFGCRFRCVLLVAADLASHYN